MRRVSRYDDGRYDLVTTGEERFRLDTVERGKPYLRGQVTWLSDEVGDAERAPDLDRAVRSGMSAYLAALGRAAGGAVESPDLPDEPRALSYAVAGALLLDLDDRQSLLEKVDATTRLSAELALLRRETSLLRALSSAPAPELARTPVNPN